MDGHHSFPLISSIVKISSDVWIRTRLSIISFQIALHWCVLGLMAELILWEFFPDLFFIVRNI